MSVPHYLLKVYFLLREPKRQSSWWYRGRRCACCERRIRFTFKAPLKRESLQDLGIRCADCLAVFCFPCSLRHFEIEDPRQRPAHLRGRRSRARCRR